MNLLLINEILEKYLISEKCYLTTKNLHFFFKTRNKAVLAKGQDFNYITDYPQDLYLFNNKTEKTKPLITYDWFPNKAKSLIRQL